MASQKNFYSELFMNYLINIFFFRLRIHHFRPLITNFYVTKRCNLKCRYCYPQGDESELDVSSTLSLLEKIRPYNPVINFTGGEPLLYRDLALLMERAKELRFYPIILSTNGLLIDKISDKLHLVDHLIISLDSLQEEINDNLSGVKGVTGNILGAIKHCAFLSGEKGFHLSIHAVITPETIGGMEEMVYFCESLDITLSVSPEHGIFYPNSSLLNNDKYTHMIDRLIAMKKQGRPIACSFGYLRTIRDFTEHRCYPHISPRVEPDGRVYFPCQRMKKRHIYLQNYNSLFELIQKEAEPDFTEDCSHRCFLACYVDVEQYIRNPFSLLKELTVRQWVFGKKRY